MIRPGNIAVRDTLLDQIAGGVVELGVQVASGHGQRRISEPFIDEKTCPIQIERSAIGLAGVGRVVFLALCLLEAIVVLVEVSDRLEIENRLVVRERFVEEEPILTDTLQRQYRFVPEVQIVI
jgi:hypothetical protein